MYERFLKFFGRSTPYEMKKDSYDTFIDAFSGVHFGKGVFNVFLKEELEQWKENVLDVFPQFDDSVRLFGYDWRGRCFAVNMSETNEEVVLIFDPGTLEIDEIPCSLLDFLNKAIPVCTNDCLASDFFIKWFKLSGTELTERQCVSYRIPLYLGGSDDINNLEVSDMEVYWYITAQIKEQIKDLDEGTRIEQFTIE